MAIDTDGVSSYVKGTSTAKQRHPSDTRPKGFTTTVMYKLKVQSNAHGREGRKDKLFDPEKKVKSRLVASYLQLGYNMSFTLWAHT